MKYSDLFRRENNGFALWGYAHICWEAVENESRSGGSAGRRRCQSHPCCCGVRPHEVL